MILAIVHTPVVAQGLLSTTPAQVLAGVIVLVIGGIGTALVRAVLKSTRQSEATYFAVAGRPASDLEPNPPPGLIRVAAGHTKAIYDMAGEQRRMSDHQLAQNGKVVNIEAMVKVIMDEELTTVTAQAIAADTLEQSNQASIERANIAKDVADTAAASKEEILDAVQTHDHD